MKTLKNKKNNIGRALLSVMFVVALVSVVFAIASFARTTSTVAAQLPANSSSSVTNGGGNLVSITVINTNTTANLTISFYDSPSTNINYTNAAYTNYIMVTSTTNEIYTNVVGRLNTNTYSVSTITNQTVSANTNNFPLITTIVVPTNSTAVWPASGTRFVRGITSTNNNTGHGGITYVYDGFGN
jgi:hypothetical protein